ncbi:toll/interleukin-1 receptor domain-containing protein [Micromonospora sp. CPCC 205561]|uniref:toll/interleukin-1 receptor domain-containing protein n=1 Tax=Micromonospora sp. CPCC 205561 TaxID=3122407 RepID=UPI002FEF77D9
MSEIFVNYRSGEHKSLVESVHTRLADHFGPHRVFLDKASIVAGETYGNQLRAGLADAKVLLVMMDRNWLPALRRRVADAEARRELDPRARVPKDWVQWEIGEALRRKLVVIPVILDGSTFVRHDELPAGIRGLADQQRWFIRSGHWRDDVDALIAKLERHVDDEWTPPAPVRPPPPRPRRQRLAALAAAGTLLVAPAAAAATGGTALRDRLLTAALWSMLLMCAPPLVLAAGMAGRHRVAASERLLHRAPPLVYNAFVALPALLAFLMLGGFVVSSVPGWTYATPVVMVAVALLVGAFGFAALREHERETSWPVTLSLRPAVLRRATVTFAERLEAWRRQGRPLSRGTRARALWHLDQLGEAARLVRVAAGRPPLTWAASEHPLAAAGHLLWSAGTVGAMLAVLTPAALDGRLTVGNLLAAVTTVTVVAGSTLATTWLAHRLHAWRRGRLAAELEATVARYVRALAELP